MPRICVSTWTVLYGPMHHFTPRLDLRCVWAPTNALSVILIVFDKSSCRWQNKWCHCSFCCPIELCAPNQCLQSRLYPSTPQWPRGDRPIPRQWSCLMGPFISCFCTFVGDLSALRTEFLGILRLNCIHFLSEGHWSVPGDQDDLSQLEDLIDFWFPFRVISSACFRSHTF